MDSKITVSDAIFNNLNLWQDFNCNGFSEQGELSSLQSRGIASIELSAISTSGQTRQGNSILFASTYSLQDGISRETIAVGFATDEVNTKFDFPADFRFDPDVYLLPNLRGYGQAPDLWTAMSLDPVLMQMVKDLMASNPQTISDLLGRVAVEPVGQSAVPSQATYFYEAGAFDNLLARWASVEINPGSNDGMQVQAVVEKFINRPVINLRYAVTPNNIDERIDPSFYLRYQELSFEFATRFVAGWGSIEDQKATLELLRDLTVLYGDGASSPSRSAGNYILDKASTVSHY